jgi:hypothetical protein
MPKLPYAFYRAQAQAADDFYVTILRHLRKSEVQHDQRFADVITVHRATLGVIENEVIPAAFNEWRQRLEREQDA